jgi:hypothetical protein
MPSRTVFTRHVNEVNSESHELYRAPMRGNKNLMNYKALIRRSSNYYAVKVGLFGSSGRIGQIAQGVGTTVIPGDLSEVRNPARAGIYSALVPGGLPGTRMGTPSRAGRGYRCPEGFQYGGRFTDNRFSTCGQMLFDIFTLGQTVGQITRPPGGRQSGAPESEGRLNVIEGMSPQERQIIVARSAQIPKIGVANPAKVSTSVTQAVKALKGAEDGATLMIRRDGFGLRPVVSTAILRTVPDNRNMEGAVFLTAVSSTGSFGKEELGLLSNTGIQELRYIAPNGVEMSLKKTRPLTVGERRKLGRTVAEVAKMDSSADPTLPLRRLAEDSNAGIEYSEKISAVSKANDFIEARVNGSKKTVRRWIYETFMSGKKPRVAESPARDEAPPAAERSGKIASLAEAVKHLDAGGDPSEVLASLLPVAMQRTRAFKAKRIDRFNQMFTGRNGRQIRETAPQYDFQHIGAKFTSDIQNQVGLMAPNVMIAGYGRRQPYYSMYRANTNIAPADNLDNLPPEEMLKLAVSDFLTDSRSRAASNTVIASNQNSISISGTDNADTALSGLAKQTQSQRQRLKIDEFLNEDRVAFYRQAFQDLTAQQRRSIVNQLGQLIDRANDFSFEEYIKGLSRDGVLSEAEKNHLQIIRNLYDARLGMLKNSKEAFLEIIGMS